MAEPDARIRTILAKLQMLSEAKAGSIGRSSHDADSERVGPPGTKPDRPSSKPPPKDRSLWAWYEWQFAAAKDDYRRRLLCYLAERDYENFHRRQPDRRRGVDDNTRGEAEDEATWSKRIVEWYEGVDILEVAILEDSSTGAIGKARRTHRRRERNGERLEGWEAWDDKRRLAEVTLLKTRRMGTQAMASRLGTSKRTVLRYLERVKVAA